MAIGDTDPELIDLYTQICDKKNYKNQEMITQLSIQIAQKYQTLGQNLKALQLIDSLRKRNIDSQEMTDITFLASIAISQNSLFGANIFSVNYCDIMSHESILAFILNSALCNNHFSR